MHITTPPFYTQKGGVAGRERGEGREIEVGGVVISVNPRVRVTFI